MELLEFEDGEKLEDDIEWIQSSFYRSHFKSPGLNTWS